jgi:26S proteasome regulatory subunit N9
LKTEIAAWHLRTKDYEGCRDLLRNVREVIDKTGHVDNTVHASYYKTYAEYLKVTEDPNEFYKNALLYLAYTPIEQLPLIEQQAMAFDLGIAALLGDHIYNFGELLGHPVVESLSGSQAEWLYTLLIAFNRGSINDYQQAVKSTTGMPDILRQNAAFLLEKVQLMSVMELVFNRPADNRIIPFNDVDKVTGVSADRVEPLLLKALAYNLIRGVIDEVQESIHVTWAQPRVLDKGQIASLQGKIGGWLDKVDKTLNYLEEQGSVGDLVVS